MRKSMKYARLITLLMAILICLVPFAGSLRVDASVDPNMNRNIPGQNITTSIPENDSTPLTVIPVNPAHNGTRTIPDTLSEAVNPTSIMAADSNTMNRIVPVAAFYGTVALNGNPAPIGTTVEARGTGVQTGVQGNPITTTETGLYGSAKPLATNLLVQGDIADGTVLRFYVNGSEAAQTTAWHAGSLSELNLTVTISSGGGGGGGSTPTLKPAPTTGAVPSPTPAPTSTPISSTIFTTVPTPTVPVTTLPVSPTSLAVQPSPSPAPTAVLASITAPAIPATSVHSAPPPSIPPEQTPSANRWPLVLGIIAAIVAVAVAFYFVWLRKRSVKH